MEIAIDAKLHPRHIIVVHEEDLQVGSILFEQFHEDADLDEFLGLLIHYEPFVGVALVIFAQVWSKHFAHIIERLSRQT